MSAVVFAPFSAISRADEPTQSSRTTLTQLANASGRFWSTPHAPPRDTHPMELVFYSPEQVQHFWDFFDAVQGSCREFWVPSFHDDFVPTTTIGAADLTIIVQSAGFTTHIWPTGIKRQVAFLRPDMTFLARTIVATVDNADGTETLTLNEALDESFTAGANRMMSSLWFVRLDNDSVTMQWQNSTMATATLTAIDLPDTGTVSGEGGTETPDPLVDCVPGVVVLNEQWDYPTTAAVLLDWPTEVYCGSGNPVGGTAGTFTIHGTFGCGAGAGGGYIRHRKQTLVEPGNYAITASAMVTPDTGFLARGIVVNGTTIGTGGVGSMVNYAATIAVPDGILDVMFGLLDLEFGVGYFDFTMGPVTATRICP